MEYFYIVIRIFYKNNKYSHSIEEIADRRQAEQRYYNVIAADLADNAVTYQFAMVLDSMGNTLLKPVVYDRRNEEQE